MDYKDSLVRNSWVELYNHYNEIKLKHNLSIGDIYRQLPNNSNVNYTPFMQYLRDPNRTPAIREGTHGKRIRDILSLNLSKTNWIPSTATYSEKLNELKYDYCSISAYVIKDSNLDRSFRPEIEVIINLDECNVINRDTGMNCQTLYSKTNPEMNLSRETLEGMFTIDNVIPKIIEIKYSRYL
jgi:hypothetical protein